MLNGSLNMVSDAKLGHLSKRSYSSLVYKDPLKPPFESSRRSIDSSSSELLDIHPFVWGHAATSTGQGTEARTPTVQQDRYKERYDIIIYQFEAVIVI